IEADRAAEAELSGHRRDAVDADAAGGFVKVDVAGFLDAVMQAHRAVTLFAPAMEGRVAQRKIAGAADRAVRGHRAGFERGQRHYRLERRAGRVNAGDSPICPRGARNGLKLLPPRGGRTGGELRTM